MPAERQSADALEVQAVLKARSSAVTGAMTVYMRRYARRHFHAVRLACGSLPEVPAGQGLLVYSNHPSWWEPVIFVLLQAEVFPSRAGFGPMDAQALGRYGLLQRIGIFGLEPDSRRGASRFLRVATGILQTPNTVLWVTAEGGFTDPRQRPLLLRPGVAHLLRSVPDVVAVPLAMELPFWNESRPEVLLRFGAPLAADSSRSVSDWNSLLTAQLTTTMDRLAEDAMTRDAGRFRSLVSGRGGVGGIYDVWRGVRAVARGERPQLEHEQAGEFQAGPASR